MPRCVCVWLAATAAAVTAKATAAVETVKAAAGAALTATPATVTASAAADAAAGVEEALCSSCGVVRKVLRVGAAGERAFQPRVQ